MLATATSDAASASIATDTGWPWKFPPDRSSPVSANTIGLSVAAFISTPTAPAA